MSKRCARCGRYPHSPNMPARLDLRACSAYVAPAPLWMRVRRAVLARLLRSKP